jgi:hypothetical protein
MSISSVWNSKVGLWKALFVSLVIIVAIQGAILYGVARRLVAWPNGFSFSIPSLKAPLPMPTQVGSAKVAVH